MAEKKKADKPVLKPLLSYDGPYMHLFAISMVLALAAVVSTLYAPILVGQGIDLIVGKENVDFEALRPLIVRLCVVVGITAVSQWTMSLCTNKITFNVVRDIRK